MMWHEARKQEKKIRGLMVDYKKRAERRRDYYEKIKADPTQFIQLHGRPCKIHLDPAVAMAADSPSTMMSWQGDRDILIDRFDVRAHLDFIPEVKQTELPLTEEESQEERFHNYERYRILVQNDFLGISEDKFFAQLALEEQYGPVTKNETSIEGKKKSQLNAAIGFKYDDGKASTDPGPSKEEPDENEEEDDDSDIDFDLSVDVSKVDTANAIELNNCAHPYGMESNDYFSFLTKDMEEAENLRLAKEEEEEKAMFSGRKSRRERRAFREKTMIGRKLSPLSFASTKISPSYGIQKEEVRTLSKSKSRSPSPVNSGKIMYITSFGEAEEEVSTSKSKDKSVDRHSKYKRSRSRSRQRSSASTSKSAKEKTSRYSSTRSRTRSPHSHRSSKKSKSKSRSPKKFRHSRDSSKSHSKSPNKALPAPPVRRYYGRNVQNSSSELELSDSDTSSNSKPGTNFSNKATSSNNKSLNKISMSTTTPKLTPQERLKKKMQKLLNKQFKADKKAEREKNQKLQQERYERAEEMRELSLKLKMKEIQKRCDTDEEWEDEEEKRSEDSKSGSNRRTRSRSRSRSNSRTPARYRPKHKSRSRSPQNQQSSSRHRLPDVHMPYSNSRYDTSYYNHKDHDMGRDRDYRKRYNSDFDGGRNFRSNHGYNENCEERSSYRGNIGYNQDTSAGGGGRRGFRESHSEFQSRGFNRDQYNRRDYGDFDRRKDYEHGKSNSQNYSRFNNFRNRSPSPAHKSRKIVDY